MTHLIYKFSQLNNQVSLREVSYLLFFGILLIAKGIGLYDGQSFFKVFLVVACFFWLFKMCITRHTVKELLIIFLLLMLGFLSYLNSGDKSALITVMVVVGMKDVEISRIYKFGVWIWSITFAGTVTLALFEVIPTLQLVHNKGILGYVIRDSLGMTHPNVLHISYMILIAFLFLAFNWKGKKIVKPIIFALVGSIYIFLYSLSYTGFVFLIAYIILIIYLNIPRRITKVEEIIIQCLMPTCVIVALVGPIVLRGNIFEFVNKLVNTRFSLSRYYLTNVKPYWIGQEMHVGGGYSIDCSYLYCLYYYGVILFVCLMLGIFFLIRHLLKKERKQELAMVLGLVAAGFTEPFLFNFSFKNLILPLLGEYFFWLISQYKIYGKLKFMENSFQVIPLEKKFDDVPERINQKIIVFLKKVISKKSKYLFTGAVIGMFLGIVAGMFMAKPEPYVIVNKNTSDRVGGKYDYQIYKNLSPDIIEHSMKINIIDEDTKVYVLSGSIVEYQELRNRISLVVYGGIGGGLIMFIVLCFAYKKKETVEGEGIT